MIKEDLKTIKEILTGNYKSRYTLREFLTVDWKRMGKDYWIFFLIIILAFFVGRMYSINIYEAKCNDLILKNFEDRGMDWVNEIQVAVDNKQDHFMNDSWKNTTEQYMKNITITGSEG